VPEGATVKTGKPREELGQLEGRSYTGVSLSVWGGAGTTSDRVKCEWVVHAPDGGQAKLTARHPRAGVVRVEVDLK
jgi:hypothetical protein